jgi:hypothetical protein
MATPDPIALLQRLSARAATGRPVSAELADEVLAWLTDAAPLILSGVPPAEALGLRPSPGSRSLARVYRKSLRDDALTRLYEFADGSQQQRGETVLGWIDAHRDGYPVPGVPVECLDEVLAAGESVPTDGGSVARIAKARAAVAPAVTVARDCGTVEP